MRPSSFSTINQAWQIHGRETVHELGLPEQIVEHLKYWLEEFQPGSDPST